MSIRPEASFIADNSQALLAAALAGLGIALLPSYLIGPALAEGALVPLLEASRPPEEGLYLVRPPSVGAPTKLRVLSDILMSRFGKDVEWDVCQAGLSRIASLAATPHVATLS